MENAKLLLQTGTDMYNKYKYLKFLSPVGLVLLFITRGFCGEYAGRYLVLSGTFVAVNLLVFAWYVMILIGCYALLPYLVGLVLIGLGQIAMNTCTSEKRSVPTFTANTSVSAGSDTTQSNNERPVFTNSSTPPAGKWTCVNCGTENSVSYGQCKKCGQYRG